MDRQQFYEELMNNVRARAELDSDFTESAFLKEVTERLVDAEEVGDLTPVHFTGTGYRKRRLAVSAYDMDESDDSIALAVMHFQDGSHVATLTEAEAKRQFAAVQHYVEESLNGTFQIGREESNEEYELAETLRRRGRSVTRYRLYLLTNKALSERAKDFPSSRVDGIPVEYHVWDIERFWRVHESTLGREELTSTSRNGCPPGSPRCNASDGGQCHDHLSVRASGPAARRPIRPLRRPAPRGQRSLVPERSRQSEQGHPRDRPVRARTVPRLQQRHHSDGHRGQPSSEAIDHQGHATCRSSMAARRPRRCSTSQRDSKTAAAVRRRRTSKRSSSSYRPELRAELVPNISRFANSQNKVSEADFFSNSPFHVRMEELSRRILTPPRPGVTYQSKWFYERTRGQYLNEKAKLATGGGEEVRRRRIPRNQVITKTDAAKYAVSGPASRISSAPAPRRTSSRSPMR